MRPQKASGHPLAPHDGPTVSVIVPTYNRPQQLVEAVGSVLAQTWHDVEILVVNDAGSSVAHALGSLALQAGQHLRVLDHQVNAGLAAARNTGLRAARGRYIAYLDDDDRFLPEHLETLLGALQASGLSVAYADALDVTQEWREGAYVTTQKRLCYSRDFDREALLVENQFPVLCVMHERACLDAVGGFDESLTRCEDWDLWIRLSRRYDFVHVPTVTAEYTTRVDGTSMRTSDPRPFLAAHRAIYARYALWASEPVRRAQAAAYLRYERVTDELSLARDAEQRADAAARLRSTCDAASAAGDRCTAAKAIDDLMSTLRREVDELVHGANLLVSLGDLPGAARHLERLVGERLFLRLEVKRLDAVATEALASRRVREGDYAALAAWRDAAIAALDLLRLAHVKDHVLIWGAGSGGRNALQVLRSLGVEPVAMLDSSATDSTRVLEGIPVMSPALLDDPAHVPSRAGVIIASVAHREIGAILDARGWRSGIDYVAATPEAVSFARGSRDAAS